MSSTNHLDAFLREVKRRNEMHYAFVTNSVQRLTPNETQRLEDYLEFCSNEGLSTAETTECYITIVFDTLKEQAFFRKNGRYRFSSFEETSRHVYQNPEYMSKYMYGLAISSFLWPNHLDILRFFEGQIERAKPGKYLEIGPGHGYYLLTAAKSDRFDEIAGIDVSPTSIAQTRSIIDHFHPRLSALVDLREVDFLNCDLPTGHFDTVVMGEVLEHVEEPKRFLEKIREIASPDAFVYLTTCVNAPAIDHIFLYRKPEEVEDMIEAAGFRICDSLVRPYEGKSIETSLADRLPINVAYVAAPA